MDIITKETLIELAEDSDGQRISIFLPTEKAGRETEAGPIRLKNLLTQAQQDLVETGIRPPDARKLLEPAAELLRDREFWQHQSDGLALYIDKTGVRYYRLPLDFEESVIVDNRFHIKPLLPMLSGDGRFFVLAFSQGDVRFLQGTRATVSELDLGSRNVPESLAEALRFDDPERQLQWHTGTRPPVGAGDRRAMFHGHGVGHDDEKTDILRFCQQVDNGINDLLGNEEAPLVLAGVGYVLDIYRQANHYPHLLEEDIEGNPEQWSNQELHQRAWPIVEPLFQSAQDKAREQYRRSAEVEPDEVSADIQEIVGAAYTGRVDTLFVALGVQHPGTFNREDLTVEFHVAGNRDQDLLDLAAVHTLLNNGTVFVVERENMPDGALIAALFRY